MCSTSTNAAASLRPWRTFEQERDREAELPQCAFPSWTGPTTGLGGSSAAWRQLFFSFWKWWVLRYGLPAGIRPPAFMFREVAPPNEVSIEDGLQAFRRAIRRLKSESQRDDEKCFHLFTRDEWDIIHIRHAELHLSFSSG